MTRSSGILMPVSSLPSPYGIGTLGEAAFRFVDFLAAAGQSWWQILPVGPTSYGDSPYQSFSTFAGNPYFIDLDALVEDGLLTKEELERDWGGDPARVDYGKIYESRFTVLRLAAERGLPRDREAVESFRRENRGWLENYALFMALKRRFDMTPWTTWEEGARLRRPQAMETYRQELKEDIEFFIYIQYLFFGQWKKLRDYAHEKGIRILGDLPIYVALDSADAWSEPQFFQLDEENLPTAVAGVPPDAFTADGQLWGNPLYNWEAMKRDGYGWWIRRVDGAGRLYDALRIDHFRGFESYWSVPAGDTTAKGGHWVKGPGMDLVGVLKNWFSNLSFIAEDLGYITPEVHRLLVDSGMPGMKVLQFAFDGDKPNDYQPHLYPPNAVCYTGTHDNEPVMGWWETLSRADKKAITAYLGLNRREGVAWGMIRGGMSSVAELFVAQMQDYLELGLEARMNTPGRAQGNWCWRAREEELTAALAEKIHTVTMRYGRCPYVPKETPEKPKKATAEA